MELSFLNGVCPRYSSTVGGLYFQKNRRNYFSYCNTKLHNFPRTIEINVPKHIASQATYSKKKMQHGLTIKLHTFKLIST